MHVHSKVLLFCFTETPLRTENVNPYIRDLVCETKELNFLTAHARMRHAIFKVSCNQQYTVLQELRKPLYRLFCFRLNTCVLRKGAQLS